MSDAILVGEQFSLAPIASDADRPEHRLLILCARSRVTAADARAIVARLRRPLDWRYLRQLAQRHGLTPLLSRNLGRYGSTHVPTAERARLRQAFQVIARRNLWVTARLSWVLGRLAEHGVDALTYKGPVTAYCAFGNVALRRFSGVNLLAAPASMKAARAALIELGYRMVADRGHEYSFQHDPDNIRIELHDTLTERRWPTGLSFERLWARARTVSPAGMPLRTLGARHTLLVMALEITRCACTERNKLIRLTDLLEAVHRRPGEDWADFLSDAVRLGQLRTVLFALRLSNDVLGLPLPATLARAIDGADLGDWPTRVRERLFRTASDGQRIDGPLLYLALRERRRDRLPMQLWRAYRRLPLRLRLA